MQKRLNAKTKQEALSILSDMNAKTKDESRKFSVQKLLQVSDSAFIAFDSREEYQEYKRAEEEKAAPQAEKPAQ